MPKFRYDSPQLCRELVQCLYHQAKAEHVTMTTLLNRWWSRRRKQQLNYQKKSSADSVLKKNLELTGFADVREVKKVTMPVLAKHMARIIAIARKLQNSPKPPKLEMA